MELDEELRDELRQIDWFACCGKDITIDGAVQESGISSIKKSIQSVRFENIVLDHFGDYTTALFLSHREDYNKWWNVLAKQFKGQYIPQLEKKWKNKLEPLGLNEPYVISNLSFNVLGIAVASAYKQLVPLPAFHTTMLEIYKSGHLICGWKGKKDSGNFIVY